IPFLSPSSSKEPTSEGSSGCPLFSHRSTVDLSCFNVLQILYLPSSLVSFLIKPVKSETTFCQIISDSRALCNIPCDDRANAHRLNDSNARVHIARGRGFGIATGVPPEAQGGRVPHSLTRDWACPYVARL